MENELLVFEESKALAVFTSGNIDPLIEAAKQIVDGFEHDLSTGVGRAKTASLAAKVSKYKVKLDAMRKGLVSEWKEKAKKVDQSGKILRDQLDKLRDEARQPLTDWENKEKERVERHESIIEFLSFGCMGRVDCIPELDFLKGELERVSKISVDSTLEEFELEASKIKSKSIEEIFSLIQKEEFRLKQEQELAQLKKEKEERDQKDRDDRLKREAAEKATREAEEKARKESDRIKKEKQDAIDQKNESDRLAKESEIKRIQSEERNKIEAENAVKNAKIAQENAAQEKKNAIERTKREAEEKQQEEINRVAKEKKQRESDMKHAGNIMKSAKECLMNYVDEATAKKIVLAIKSGKIDNVTINF